MTLRQALRNFAKVASDEAERNPEFEQRLREALGIPNENGQPTRVVRRGRRTAAVLNPVEIVNESEQKLRDQLSNLTVEQLKDIVAGYGMDPSKLVMKWRKRERITDHIVQTALVRSQKGNAFRND